jgi:uncharacterized protein DUF1523
MRYVKWTLIGTVVLLVFSFLQYTLPQKDVVRITGTEVIRQDFSGWNRIFYAQPDAGNVEGVNRDLRLINAVYPNGKVIVYRNEDTGWGWPPYFKFDTSNLQAEAADLVSTRDAPRWAVVTHYGWRVIFWSVYPNAMSLREVDSPDVRLIPWFNIIFLTLLALIGLRIYRMIQRFREKRIDPVLEDIGEAFDTVGDHADAAQERASGLWGRFQAWLNTWRSKK